MTYITPKRTCELVNPSTPLLGTAIKHPVPARVKPSFVIFDILTFMAERQSARMSKIINDRLIRAGTGRFIAVPVYPYGNSKHQRVKLHCQRVVYRPPK